MNHKCATTVLLLIPGTLRNTMPSAGCGGQFFQLINFPPGNTGGISNITIMFILRA